MKLHKQLSNLIGMGVCIRICLQSTPCWGEAVFLQAAVGLVWQGHFNEFLLKQTPDLFVQLTRNRLMPQ